MALLILAVAPTEPLTPAVAPPMGLPIPHAGLTELHIPLMEDAGGMAAACLA